MTLPTLCRSQKFCAPCRDTGPAGVAWRASVRGAGARLPDVCPHAKPWTGNGPRPTAELVAPMMTRTSRGTLARKPWEYRVTAVVPHLNTPELLPLVIGLLRLQTERPYILIVDTGSPWAVVEGLEKLRAPDVEIHYVRGHGYQHSSDLVTIAMDLAFARCASPLLFATHADAFLRRRDVLADLAARCTAKTPVVAWGMSERQCVPAARGRWEKCPGHVCAMHHVETLDRLGVSWGIRRYVSQFGTGTAAERSTGIWPDTEACLGAILAEAAAADPSIRIEFLGRETNAGRQVTADFDHVRSTTGLKLYSPNRYAEREDARTAAMREAQERIDQWRADDAAAALAAPPAASDWATRGPKLWARLHRRPLLWTGAEAEIEWLATFEKELTGCGCRRHWLGMMAATPPDLSSPAAYARWQHARHNDVRERLGQPTMAYDAAASLWGWHRLTDVTPDESSSQK